MKHTLCILLAVLLATGLAACSAPAASAPAASAPAASAHPAQPAALVSAAPVSPSQPAAVTPTAAPASAPSTTASPAVVKFADPALETMVRAAMGRPEGVITAAEAEAVTWLNLSIEWKRYISQQAPIENLGGIESFVNLESLDLSFHAIRDITPLAGLENLTWLSLEGNPVADITPLAGLTGLKGLNLSNAAAQQYRSLAKLVNLELLMLANSTIADISPLSSLTGLKQLYLAGCPVDDYSPLADIYPDLEKRDFTLASTLQDLGFTFDDGSRQAIFDGEDVSVRINHAKWGAPPIEGDANCVRISMYLEGDYKLSIGYYPEINAYVFFMVKDGETLMDYVYNAPDGSFTFGTGDRESTEQAVRAAIDAAGAEDVLLAPVSFFQNKINSTLHMTADALYAMPYEPPTLKNLGFFPDKANAVCLYEQRDGKDVNLEVHRPEWGEKEYDVRFFTPLSDEYRIVVTYNLDERKYVVGVDDNDLGGASFEFFAETKEHVDVWDSKEDLTVEEYFVNAYNDPDIEDIYLHSVALVEQYFIDRFSLTIEELYALPTCE